jgi:hypothetical protein
MKCKKCGMKRCQCGIAAIGVIGLVAVVGLFVSYVSGHPLPWNKKAPVAVVEPVVIVP